MFLPFFSVLLPLNTGKELGSNLLAVLKCNAYPQLFLFVFELELRQYQEKAHCHHVVF